MLLQFIFTYYIFADLTLVKYLCFNFNRFRRLLDTTRALDSASSRVDNVEALFQSELLSRRDKVKHLCEKLLFEQPEKYGLVSRDRLWRSVFYDVMCRAKRLRRVSFL